MSGIESLSLIQSVTLKAAGCALAGLAVASCSSVPEEIPPQQGIVVGKSTRMVEGDVCLFSSNNVCLLYNRVPEYVIKIAGCEKNDEGQNVLASPDYLHQAAEDVAGNPVIGEGIDQMAVDGGRYYCGGEVVTTEESYKGVSEGQYYEVGPDDSVAPIK